MENEQIKGITIQLLHISAQIEVLTDYIMKDSSQSERDEIKEKASSLAQERLRVLDVLDSMIIPE